MTTFIREAFRFYDDYSRIDYYLIDALFCGCSIMINNSEQIAHLIHISYTAHDAGPGNKRQIRPNKEPQPQARALGATVCSVSRR